jgi:predicted DNA binding CopG/RHH family protein
MKSQKRSRVNMRIPTDLLTWAKEYASKKQTCVTQMFVTYLTKLRERTGHDV